MCQNSMEEPLIKLHRRSKLGRRRKRQKSGDEMLKNVRHSEGAKRPKNPPAYDEVR
mgnify:CR=1 FL=1